MSTLVEGADARGGRLAVQKNTCALTQRAAGSAKTLKIIRYEGCPFRASDREMTSASRATVIVPAAGPKSSVEVKTNVSEIDMVAGTEGNLTVAAPATNVRTARTNQLDPMGCVYSEYSE